jgi:hypothetical protein
VTLGSTSRPATSQPPCLSRKPNARVATTLMQENTNNDSLFNVIKCMNMDIVLTNARASPFFQTCHLIHHFDFEFVKLAKKGVLHCKPLLVLCRLMQHLWGINPLHEQPLDHG